MNDQPIIPASFTTDSQSARQQDIAARAYALWRENGSPWGREDEFWYLAEREITARPVAQTVGVQSSTAESATAPAESSAQTVVTPQFDGTVMKADVVPTRSGDASLATEVDKALDNIGVPGRDRASPTSATV